MREEAIATRTGADERASVTPEQWERAADVFVEALSLPPEDRGAWLARVLADAPAVLQEVEAMLTAHERVAPLRIEERLLAAPAASAAASDDIASGTRIGPYRVEALVGEGGMGVVYRAERADGEYGQTVALKVLRAGMAAADLVRRFQLERQILARLVHPNIVPILDGGQLPDGRPYLVMRYVEGTPITDCSERNGLGLAARLQLFRRVADAVQFAHGRLVVHRDIKPSNILVDATGEPFLLDFGIAKVLEEENDGLPRERTRSFLRWLTPDHAAPEQLRGEPATTATDVYALGVLLFQLLTGRGPYGATRRPLAALQRRILDEPAPAPSTVANSITDARRLRGDLDRIVLMALRKEPERRYASAGQFAEDVDRFLAGRPVLAQPDTLRYRVRKFVGRNRSAVSLAALATLSLLAGLIGTTSQAWRARAEATQAAADRDRAERVSALLVDMFRLSDPNSTRGQTVTAREVLAAGAARIARDLDRRPDAQADLLTEIGNIYENLGLFEDASTHLERALALRQSLYGNEDARVAESLTRLARVRTRQQRTDDAVRLSRTAVAILRGSGEPRQPHASLASALLALGGALRSIPAPTEAADIYADALAVLDRQTPRDDARTAEAYFGRADAAHSQGQFDLADSLLVETIARFERLGGAPHPDAATALFNLGQLRMFRGQEEEAEPFLRRALGIRQQIYGSVHPAVEEVLDALARSLLMLERLSEAVAIGEEAVLVADSVWGRDNMNASYARQTLGLILREADQADRALSLLQDAYTVQRAQLGATHPLVLSAERDIGVAYVWMGAFDRARALFNRLLDEIETYLGPDHASRALVLLELAKLDLDDGKLDNAEAKARESIALTHSRLRPDHRFASLATITLARVHADRGQLILADSLVRDVLATQRATRGEQHPETARTLVQLADLETRLGRLDDAEAHARAALSVLEEYAQQRARLAEARSVLGAILAAQGRISEAEPLLRGALETLKRMRYARPRQIEAAAARLDRLTP